MAPIEKYQPKAVNGNERPQDGGQTPDQQANLQKQLVEFRAIQREKYARRKREVISEALKDAKADSVDNDEEFSDKDAKKMARVHHRERVKNYREAVKDQKEMSATDFAFNEITDFKFNKETFRGEGGWLQEFRDTDAKDKSTLEEFVLEKQYGELTAIRETLLEVRVGDRITQIYANLDGDDKKADRTKKSKEVSKDAKAFFQNNADDIEKYASAKSTDKAELRKTLYAKFKANVFGDVKENDTEIDILVNTLFVELLDDYEAMLTAREKAKLLNPKMVQLLMKEGLTEDEWQEQLAKEAEIQAKKLEEKAKVNQQEQIIEAAPPAEIDGRVSYYNGAISVDDSVGSNSPVLFEQVAPGKYLVKFPTEGLNGTAEARFTVKEVREADKTFKVFVFNDPLMDRPAIVKDGSFKAQINGLYLEKVMSDTVKEGQDYLGPRLNDIIHDQEMFSIAEHFFTPKRLNEMALTKPEAEDFRKLMLLLVSTGNNQPGEGIYGDLLPMRNRVSLLKLVLESPARAQSIRSYFTSATIESIKEYSLERLLQQKGIPPNYGNFNKD